MTQPAFPARPYQAPLAPGTPPRALPGPPAPQGQWPPQPHPPQPHPAPTYPPPSYPAPAAYDRPGYEQGPRAPQGFEPFRPARPQGPPPLGPIPTGPPGPPPGPPRQPPRRHDGRRSGSSLPLLIVLLVLLVGGGLAGVLIAHPFGHPAIKETASTATRPTTSPSANTGSATATAPASTASPATSTTTSTGAPAVTEQQAAATLATMLSQSVSDRAAIIGAASDVGNCGPHLSSDAKVFDDAASSRKSLLASLTTMPGRTALPAAMLSDLTKAWQASIAADQGYAQWANDENTQGCVANDTSDPGYQATVTPNTNATTYKTAFVGQWNPVAAKYGLTKYDQDQL